MAAKDKKKKSAVIGICLTAGAIILGIGIFRKEDICKIMQNSIYAQSHERKTLQTDDQSTDTVHNDSGSQKDTAKGSNDLLTLINYRYPIPENWEVDLVDLQNGHQIDKRAYPSLQAMLDDARADGMDPLICSSYRSREKQERLYNDKLNRCLREGYGEEEAKKEAARWVAPPNTSEHQSGLAVDIVSVGNQNLDESQVNTATQQWLMQNSWRYGFILRYPTDKSEITHIGYEPWHYRYVGKEAAKEIYEQKICLEEYLAMD